jgi:hypothetical protein
MWMNSYIVSDIKACSPLKVNSQRKGFSINYVAFITEDRTTNERIWNPTNAEDVLQQGAEENIWIQDVTNMWRNLHDKELQNV